ncbi:hypothetical protein II906_02160, partial [bacterium]|nr:hypothetical protein [bacterium]
LKYVLKSEGGYSNNKADRGGATNYGITQRTYDAYLNKNKLPHKNVANITYEEVKRIYFREYWQASGADKISDFKLALILFDSAVNHGVNGAKVLYQKSGVDAYKLLELRKQKYLNIVQKNPSQKVFLKGWLNRIDFLFSLLS